MSSVTEAARQSGRLKGRDSWEWGSQTTSPASWLNWHGQLLGAECTTKSTEHSNTSRPCMLASSLCTASSLSFWTNLYFTHISMAQRSNKTNTGTYRSCAALLAISNPLILILVWPGFLVCMWTCEFVCGLVSSYVDRMRHPQKQTHTKKTWWHVELLRNLKLN